MAGFGMILGGALQGYGNNILEQAKARREAALKFLEQQMADERQTKRDEREMEFRRSESQTDRDFRAKEGKLDRDARAAEFSQEQAGKGEYGTTQDGGSVFIQGGKARPVTGQDGKPVKLAGTKADKPAEVSTAEWLVQQGVAKDASEAWRLVRSARDDPEKSRGSIYKAWLTTLKPEFGAVDSEALQAEATKRTEETMRFLESAETGPAPAPAGEAAPPAPRDKAVRVIGRIYSAPDGRKVRWTGEGWELVP